MKRALCLFTVILLAIGLLSCQKNYNHYRELVYGKWDLIGVDGEIPSLSEQLYFKSSTKVTLTVDGQSYDGEYQFYCNLLTTYFETNQNLYQEWRVETMKDSLMRAVIELREVNGDTLEVTGTLLEYKKLP
ncbi:MAG: hypothetical protein WC128_00610 [Bacteroidales bacterium]|jgi:hypothetical protein